ncbi:hypothetical protein [Vannielia litorea]|uniref:hypothetical protein n=1 Tax=Vannielia litorea TaxID=1217970 RepID=UPI001C9690B5|nr:hypothetical protein [Vannielia litorea]MBY6047020.1 hypothetical protein [Vannielia litorea]MBY6074434.1 hypothetical protein [Vannielia litorea]
MRLLIGIAGICCILGTLGLLAWYCIHWLQFAEFPEFDGFAIFGETFCDEPVEECRLYGPTFVEGLGLRKIVRAVLDANVAVYSFVLGFVLITVAND